MKTKIINCANRIDEAIPDLTLEIAKSEAKDIAKSLKATAGGLYMTYLYVAATNVAMASALVSTAKLTGITAKTVVKKAALTGMDIYYNTPDVTVRR